MWNVLFQLTKPFSWRTLFINSRKFWRYCNQKGTSQLRQCTIVSPIYKRWISKLFSSFFIINKVHISNIWLQWNLKRMVGSLIWDSKLGLRKRFKLKWLEVSRYKRITQFSLITRTSGKLKQVKANFLSKIPRFKVSWNTNFSYHQLLYLTVLRSRQWTIWAKNNLKVSTR